MFACSPLFISFYHKAPFSIRAIFKKKFACGANFLENKYVLYLSPSNSTDQEYLTTHDDNIFSYYYMYVVASAFKYTFCAENKLFASFQLYIKMLTLKL